MQLIKISWDAEKAMFRWKFIAINVYVKKEGRTFITI